MSRTCRSCLKKKEDSEFNKKRSTSFQGECRTCQNAYQRSHYRANREMYVMKNRRLRRLAREVIVEAKNVPCMDCGKSYPHYVMDFDHRDPEEKEIDLSKAINRQWSADRILAEIAKCDVVCSNCHRERTHGGS